MLLDQNLIFSDAQVLTATAVSTNVIDFGVARDPGAGEPLWLLFQFGTVTGTGPTWNYALKGADDAGITTNAVTKAALPAAITPTSNSFYAVRVDPGAPKRYWRVDYTIGGTTPSIPTLAGFVKNSEVKFHSRTYL